MSSDYSVTVINNNLPSNSRSSENRCALVIRKHSILDDDRKKTIANLTDDEILLTSIKYAENKTDKTVAGKLEKALPSLFVTAVPLVFGALYKGSFSDKVKTAVSTALIFGSTLALFNKYDRGVNRVENASKKVEDMRQKHPVAAAIFNMAAKAGLAFGAYALLAKSGKFLQNKFKPSADKLNESIAKTSEKLDVSLPGRGVEKLNNKIDGFLDKHPKISKFISKNSFLTPALTLLGWVGFEAAVYNKALETKYNYASKMADELIVQRELAKI